MVRRKSIDPGTLEAAKQFDSKQFIETVKAEFADFPDARLNQKRILYSFHLNPGNFGLRESSRN